MRIYARILYQNFKLHTFCIFVRAILTNIQNIMFYEAIRIRPFLHIILSIYYSLQQQILCNDNIFGKKMHLLCNEGSLYFDCTRTFEGIHSTRAKPPTMDGWLQPCFPMTVAISIRENWCTMGVVLLQIYNRRFRVARCKNPWKFSQLPITETRLFKYIENFTTKKGKCFYKKFRYFSYFCSKHRLWVLVRTASARRF